MPPENRRRRHRRNRPKNTESWSEEDRLTYALKQKLETPIAEMKLSVRIINTLEDNNVILAGDLLVLSHEDLLEMKNFGDKTLTEVKQALRLLGIEPPSWEKSPKSDNNLLKFW